VSVEHAVADTLTRLGVETVFGLVGSSNFHLTNALIAGGTRFLSSRHEAAAVSMADAYARVSGQLPIVSLHHGNGLTNAVTPLVEAVKSNSPLLVVVPEADPGGRDLSFHVDQAALVASLGAEAHTLTSARNAVAETTRAWRRAAIDGATVVLNLPVNVLAAAAEPVPAAVRAPLSAEPPAPDARAVARLAELVTASRRPVFIAGRGARGARASLEELAERCGALLATSQAARGLFAGSDWELDVAGGFSTPTTARLIAEADLVVGWGASLNVWTLRAGEFPGADATLVQVDHDPAALGRQPRVDVAIRADVTAAARALTAHLAGEEPRTGYRTPAVREQIAVGAQWSAVAYDDEGGDGLIDPRTLTRRLDELLPAQRVVCTDIGNHSSFPMLFLRVPDEHGLCAPIGFVAVGLGLASAIGAAVARPDRQVVAAIGDGGLFMSASELETVVREKLPLLAVVYNDDAYGAESLQFGPGGHDIDTVVFPPTDLAAIARGYGWQGVTVREEADLEAVADWLAGPRERPLLVDAKIASFSTWVAEHMAAVYVE